MTAIPFPGPLPEPHWDVIDAWRAEFLEVASRIARPQRPRLVPDEPEWDSADSNAYQDRVEAGLEPEWPDD